MVLKSNETIIEMPQQAIWRGEPDSGVASQLVLSDGDHTSNVSLDPMKIHCLSVGRTALFD
jgi:hypothetical protein